MKFFLMNLCVFLIVLSFTSASYGDENLSQSLHYQEEVVSEVEKSSTETSKIQKDSDVKVHKNYFDIHADEKEQDRFFYELINMLSTLGLIVGGVLIVAWFLKKILHGKIQQLNGGSLIKVIEHRTLSPRTTIYLLDIKGEGMIIGESMNGVYHLGNFQPDRLSVFPSTDEEIKKS